MINIDELQQMFHNIAEQLNIPPLLIKFVTNKDDSVSIWIVTAPASQGKETTALITKYVEKAKKYFLVSNAFLRSYDKASEYDIHATASEKLFSRLAVSDFVITGFDSPLIEFFKDLTLFTIKSSVSDFFGCCGFYVECSDAKKCLHNDIIRSYACAYRNNLEAGRIFYGINKNV